MPYTCGSCRSEFPSGWQAREEHCNETGHQKPSWGRDSASLNRKQPFECYTCEQQFPSGYNSRNQHCQDTGHTRPEFECDHCDKTFNSELVRFQHMREQNHFAYECRQCCDTFPSEESRVEHEADSHYLCAECDRDFASRHDVQQVRYRPFHPPLSSILLSSSNLLSSSGLLSSSTFGRLTCLILSALANNREL